MALILCPPPVRASQTGHAAATNGRKPAVRPRTARAPHGADRCSTLMRCQTPFAQSGARQKIEVVGAGADIVAGTVGLLGAGAASGAILGVLTGATGLALTLAALRANADEQIEAEQLSGKADALAIRWTAEGRRKEAELLCKTVASAAGVASASVQLLRGVGGPIGDAADAIGPSTQAASQVLGVACALLDVYRTTKLLASTLPGAQRALDAMPGAGPDVQAFRRFEHELLDHLQAWASVDFGRSAAALGAALFETGAVLGPLLGAQGAGALHGATPYLAAVACMTGALAWNLRRRAMRELLPEAAQLAQTLSRTPRVGGSIADHLGDEGALADGDVTRAVIRRHLGPFKPEPFSGARAASPDPRHEG